MVQVRIDEGLGGQAAAGIELGGRRALYALGDGRYAPAGDGDVLGRIQSTQAGAPDDDVEGRHERNGSVTACRRQISESAGGGQPRHDVGFKAQCGGGRLPYRVSCSSSHFARSVPIKMPPGRKDVPGATWTRPFGPSNVVGSTQTHV